MEKIIVLMLVLLNLNLKAQHVDSLKLMEDLKELSSDTYKGRQTGTHGNRLAQYFLSGRFKEIGLAEYNEGYKTAFGILTEKINRKLHDSILSNYKFIYGANIIGFIPGEDPKAIIVSAHYDHLGIIKGQIYNGADDNASGTCALLALAAYFRTNPPKHTLIFVAFDAEEMGLKGSFAFVTKPPIPVSQMLLNINMDMIGTSQSNSLFIGGTRYSPEFSSMIKNLMRTQKDIEIGFGYDNDDMTSRMGRSDHAAFYIYKVPFLYFGVPEHTNYHQPGDDYSNISHSFYYSAVNFILKTIIAIDKNFPVPEK